MEIKHVMTVIHYGAFGMIIGMAVFGIYSSLLLMRQLRRRKFRDDESANEFLGRLGESLRRGNFDEAESHCTAPEHWYRALSNLAQLAIEKRNLPVPKIKQAIAARFTREVLTGLESLLASINLVVKCEPMLGLLGTVVGMIGAFSTIATMVNPNAQDLMKDLSVALNATAMGLSVAIPMLVIASYFQVKIRKFEDETYEQIQTLLEQMDASSASGHRSRSGQAPVRVG